MVRIAGDGGVGFLPQAAAYSHDGRYQGRNGAIPKESANGDGKFISACAHMPLTM